MLLLPATSLASSSSNSEKFLESTITLSKGSTSGLARTTLLPYVCTSNGGWMSGLKALDRRRSPGLFLFLIAVHDLFGVAKSFACFFFALGIAESYACLFFFLSA